MSLGALLLVAYAAHTLGARVHIPRVTLLLLVGVFGGPLGLNLLPAGAVAWFPEVSEMTLAMVGFCWANDSRDGSFAVAVGKSSGSRWQSRS
jgi:hypothetical protein